MKISSVLGLNARTKLFSYPYNTKRGRNIARSKILTDKVLRNANIPTPIIYKKFRSIKDIYSYNWEKLPESFAVKPSKGLGGEGIIVVKERAKDPGFWLTTQKKKIGVADLKLHIMDVLEGAYSLGNYPDVAFIQEFVGRHKAFRKYAYRGTPDIRIIVFNRVPTMAMLRLPTKESGGRANLHQGAIGVGIDIATGITTKALYHGNLIKYKPGTERKLNGIKIPHWEEILKIAVSCQEVSGLGYLGVDIVLHPEKGPMVLELNSQPGLQIQLANMAGLKKRLERIEDLEVRDAEHGVRIAKSLFAERFLDRVKAEEGIKIVKASEEVKVLNSKGEKFKVLAKVDTGSWSSSIDKNLAKNLGLLNKNKILWYKKKMSSLGKEERSVIPLTFWIAGRKVDTRASVSDRDDLTYPLLIGRIDLAGFLVNPEIDKEKLIQAKKW